MSWETLLFLSILGTAAAVGVVALATGLGIRYRRELPKLPIKESLEALTQERDKQEAALAELDGALSAAREDIREGDRVRQFLEDSQPQVQSLQQELEELIKEKGKAESETVSAMEELEKANGSLKGVRDQLEEAESALNPLRQEQSHLAGVLEGLREQRETLLQSIEQLKQTHAAAGGVDGDTDSRGDLWVPIFKKSATRGTTDEQQRLAGMASQLENAGVRIPARTIRAFHTALKIQDISPLTVLAGISGTGKSLLPRLYSKCMGLHFLNLPVQPGWNSPQDLFGFYNYIEHRFKATPLARALVQFDQFNRSKWPLPTDNEGLEDQLLIVLLDEMNLARVEYYFSELLSRLEVRRSIDASDAIERMKVEIPLEIGHAMRRRGDEIEDVSVSVYPGENVLFTGTMNEDESTMSLSDKVLDRATVLRFGRPAETVTVQPKMHKIESSGSLALATWQGWLRRGEFLPDVREAVKELEEIMARAGAPFGHRVSQGITHYISLYPDSTPNGQRMALTDQIEQRVLPKLRGRELGSIQDALDRLTRLIRRMGDPQLIEAIQAGKNDLEGTFFWAGIDRTDDGA
jgi:archaellum component FlaC